MAKEEPTDSLCQLFLKHLSDEVYFFIYFSGVHAYRFYRHQGQLKHILEEVVPPIKTAS